MLNVQYAAKLIIDFEHLIICNKKPSVWNLTPSEDYCTFQLVVAILC